MSNEEALEISRLLYQPDEPADKLLRAKCQWEHMTRMAVILKYGDPREWEKP